MMTVKELQRALIARGYEPGRVDGKYGPRTKAAVRAFQKDAGLVVDAIAGPITQGRLAWPMGDVPEGPSDHPRLTDKGLLALAIREGVVLETYLDSASPPVLTIGIGHSAAAGPPKPVRGLKISLVQAISLFRRDVVSYESRVRHAIKVPLLAHQWDSLISFEYNTGGLGRSVLARTLNAGKKNPELIEQCFRGWLRPPEVEDRRMGEFRQFMYGDYGDLSEILVYESVTPKGYPDRKSCKKLSTAGLFA